jgi:hypothetical protein
MMGIKKWVGAFPAVPVKKHVNHLCMYVRM